MSDDIHKQVIKEIVRGLQMHHGYVSPEWSIILLPILRREYGEKLDEIESLRDELGITGDEEQGLTDEETEEILRRQSTPFKELYVGHTNKLETKLKKMVEELLDVVINEGDPATNNLVDRVCRTLKEMGIKDGT